MWGLLLGVALAADPVNGWLPGATPDEAGDVELSVDAGGGGLYLFGFSGAVAGGARLRVSPIRALRISAFGGAGTFGVLGAEGTGAALFGGGVTVAGQLVDGPRARLAIWAQAGAYTVAAESVEGNALAVMALPGVSFELGQHRARFVAGIAVPVQYLSGTLVLDPIAIAAASEIALKLAYDDGGIVSIGKLGPGLGVKIRKPWGRAYGELMIGSSGLISAARLSVGWRFGPAR